MDINKIKEISLDYFSKTDIGAELKSILEAYERIQEAAALFADHDNEKRLVKIRIGTILTFGTASRILKGKWPKDYSKDDWIDLVNMVSEYAVKVDDQNYSVFIFKLYADYIDASITMLAGNVSEDTLNPIKCLAEELRKKSDLFEDNGIGESEYTEECLWICLDAMIKLLSATVTKYAGEELGHFTEGLASVAFEYGRLMLYRKEQELLKQYIENQHVLDEELQDKYEDYLRELSAQTDSFLDLIDNAFSPDFRCALKGSVELAKAAEVSENEILSSKEQIDHFFLD